MHNRLFEVACGYVLQTPSMHVMASHLSTQPLEAVLAETFVWDADEIALIEQEAWWRSLATLYCGLAPLSSTQLDERIVRELKAAFAELYLSSFAAQQEYSARDLTDQLGPLAEGCLLFLQSVPRLLSSSSLAPFDFHSLLSAELLPRPGMIRQITEAQLTTAFPGQGELIDLLSHKKLLEYTLLYFFQQRLRKDERYRKTLHRLVEEGLWFSLEYPARAEEQLLQGLSRRCAQMEQEEKQAQEQLADASQRGDFSTAQDILKSMAAIHEGHQRSQALLQHIPDMIVEAQVSWQAMAGGFASFVKRFGDLFEALHIGLSSPEDLLANPNPPQPHEAPYTSSANQANPSDIAGDVAGIDVAQAAISTAGDKYDTESPDSALPASPEQPLVAADAMSSSSVDGASLAWTPQLQARIDARIASYLKENIEAQIEAHMEAHIEAHIEALVDARVDARLAVMMAGIQQEQAGRHPSLAREPKAESSTMLERNQEHERASMVSNISITDAVPPEPRESLWSADLPWESSAALPETPALLIAPSPREAIISVAKELMTGASSASIVESEVPCEQSEQGAVSLSKGPTVREFCYRVALSHLLWIEAYDPEQRAPLSDQTRLEERAAVALRGLGELQIHGRLRADKTQELLEESCGLPLLLYTPTGKRAVADQTSKSLRSDGGKWAFTLGSRLFVILKPATKEGVEAPWKKYKAANFGKALAGFFGDAESRAIQLVTARGTVNAHFDTSKHRFSRLGDLFDVYPELQDHDAICITQREADIFQWDVIFQDPQAGMESPDFVWQVKSESTKVEDLPLLSMTPPDDGSMPSSAE